LIVLLVKGKIEGPIMTTAFRIDCERFHRRDFLRLGTAGLLGLGLADLLRLEANTNASRRKATSVLMVWLAGGPSTIDIWDLKPDAPENIRGEFKPIATSAKGVHICELMPKTAKLFTEGWSSGSGGAGLGAHDLGDASARQPVRTRGHGYDCCGRRSRRRGPLHGSRPGRRAGREARQYVDGPVGATPLRSP